MFFSSVDALGFISSSIWICFLFCRLREERLAAEQLAKKEADEAEAARHHFVRAKTKAEQELAEQLEAQEEARREREEYEQHKKEAAEAQEAARKQELEFEKALKAKNW